MAACRFLLMSLDRRLERRHVKNARFVRQAGVEPALDQGSMTARKAARVLPDPVGGADQGMGTGSDRSPRTLLHGGRGGKLALEPTRDCGMKAVRTHSASIRESAIAFPGICRLPQRRPERCAGMSRRHGGAVHAV